MFVDTIILIYYVMLARTQLGQWRREPTIERGVVIKDLYTNKLVIDGCASVDFRYHPVSLRYPNPALTIQFSVPMLLYGNNFHLGDLPEIEDAITKLNSYIKGSQWLPNIDIENGVLNRVDLVTHYPVGDSAPDYVLAISHLHFPHRKRKIEYQDQSIYFVSHTATAKFYIKYDPLDGTPVLRHESGFRPTKTLEVKMGIQHPTLRDISMPWIQEMLQKDGDALKLSNLVIGNEEYAYEILRSTYDVKTANRLTGFLVGKRIYTLEQMIANGLGESTIRTYEKLITDAGLSPTLSDTGVHLPPLISGGCSNSSGKS